MHDLAGRSPEIGRVAHPGSHDEIGWGAIDWAGFPARFLLAKLTSKQFRL